MDRPIQVGDLVQVVRWYPCNCCGGQISRVVSLLLDSPCNGCSVCGSDIPLQFYALATLDGFGEAPIQWLKRIPPLSELEGAQTQEKLREPA